MGDLSPHFSRWEFAEHGSGLLPEGMPDQRLVDILECVRRVTGGTPLRIISGYRSAAYNRRIGGAVDSRHIHGAAADIQSGRCTVEQALACGAIGVGHDRNGFAVHLDVRAGHPVTFLDI